MPIKKLLSALSLSLISLASHAVDYDYDNDGKADIAVRRASNGFQYILNSSGTSFNSERGDSIQRIALGNQETDIPVSGDFDGDGIWDVGVRRPTTFEWVIRYSSTGEINTFTFGRNADDIPVPADYDGDGTTDLAVRRPSTQYWYIKNSGGIDEITGNSDGITRLVFGRQETDIPVPADYDGDGKADIAVRRPSNFYWYIKNSSGTDFNSDRGDGIQRIQFGRSDADIPVPADYNGDGYADIAVRRPSNFTWYIKNSNGDNYNSDRGDGIQRIVFGKDVNDIPVPADYDGDGYADVAVRRATNQYFYIKNSSGSNFNSDRQDGIQRLNFGKQARDIAFNKPNFMNTKYAPEFYVGEGFDVIKDKFIDTSFSVTITNTSSESELLGSLDFHESAGDFVSIEGPGFESLIAPSFAQEVYIYTLNDFDGVWLEVGITLEFIFKKAFDIPTNPESLLASLSIAVDGNTGEQVSIPLEKQ